MYSDKREEILTKQGNSIFAYNLYKLNSKFNVLYEIYIYLNIKRGREKEIVRNKTFEIGNFLIFIVKIVFSSLSISLKSIKQGKSVLNRRRNWNEQKRFFIVQF